MNEMANRLKIKMPRVPDPVRQKQREVERQREKDLVVAKLLAKKEKKKTGLCLGCLLVDKDQTDLLNAAVVASKRQYRPDLVRVIYRVGGSSVLVPVDEVLVFPASNVPEAKKCDCGNIRKYVDKLSGKNICSLQCSKKIIRETVAVQQISALHVPKISPQSIRPFQTPWIK